MRKTALSALALAAATAALLSISAARAEWVWRSDSGWVNTRQAPTGEVEHTYNHSVALMARNNHATALNQLEIIEAETSGEMLWKIRLRIVECLIKIRKFADASDLSHRTLTEGLGYVDPLEAWRIRLEAADAGLANSRAVELVKLRRTFREVGDDAWSADALWVAGEFCLDQGLREDGMEMMDRLRKSYPDDPRVSAALMAIADATLEISAVQNLAGNVPRSTVSMYEEYFIETGQLAPPKMAERMELVRRAAEETDPDARKVLYAFIALSMGNPDRAADIARPVAGFRKGDATGEAAAYCLAEALYEADRPAEALDAALDYIRTYPAGRYYDDAQAVRFRSSVRLMEQGRAGGLREMQKIFDENPRGPLADRAIIEQGKYWMAQERHVQAKRLFDSVIEDYPGRGTYAEAIFRQGQARLGQANYHPHNPEIYNKARESFEIYLLQYPHGEFADEARELLNYCKGREADHLLGVARFYEGRGRDGAARATMELIARDFPETTAAETARGWLGNGEAAIE